MDLHLYSGSFRGTNLKLEKIRKENLFEFIKGLKSIATEFKGILTVSLSTYKVARLEPPHFDSFESICRLAREQSILCLLHSSSSSSSVVQNDPIQQLYESYTSTKKRINVFECQYKLYNCIDTVLLNEWFGVVEEAIE